MILIALKNIDDTSKIKQTLNEYFDGKVIPSYKFISKFEKFNSWIPLLIDPQEYDLEEDLIEYLSKELNAIVFGYEYQDTVTAYILYLYNSGECVDEFTTLDFDISHTYGHFAYLDDLPEEEKADLETHEVLSTYYNEIGFDPDYVSFEDQY